MLEKSYVPHNQFKPYLIETSCFSAVLKAGYRIKEARGGRLGAAGNARA